MAIGEVAATTITIGDDMSSSKGKAHATTTFSNATASTAAEVVPRSTTARVTPFAAIKAMTTGKGGLKRGLAILDFILRLSAFATTVAAAITMGTTDETLPFVTEYFQFYANFSDLPALMFFVIGNAIAGGYLIFSSPFSIFSMVRPHVMGPRVMLLVLDTVMVGLVSAASSSAAAIVYLAHAGNSKVNWSPICEQFDGFCQQINGAVVVSFIATFLFMMLVAIAALSLKKH